jgi:hypothetical protein
MRIIAIRRRGIAPLFTTQCVNPQEPHINSSRSGLHLMLSRTDAPSPWSFQMTHIPRILNCAAVKVLAVLDDDHLTDHADTDVAANPSRNDVTQLAICQRKGDSRFQFYCCDKDWRTVSTEYFDSLDLATTYAEQQYPGVNEQWITPAVAVERQQ